MKKPHRANLPAPASAAASAAGGRARRLVLICAAVALGIGVGAAFAWHRFQAGGSRQARSISGPVTFHRDIAPILYERCATCHHPGESAPFSLLDYADAVKHARQIVEVTSQRLMPPWLPAPGYAHFLGDRSLTDDQIQRLRRWVEEGLAEGQRSDAPPAPRWNEGWQLGPPDLVIQLAKPYTVPAEGRDIYRNFVIPIPVTGPRYVRAVEFMPGNARVVHHAFMFIDPSRDARRRDELDPEPGFPGWHVPPSVQTPPGHFLSWQPGKVASKEAEDLAWLLQKDCDLVVQMHLRPSGKPEQVQPSIGFFFSSRPATKTPFKFGLMKLELDIPAGASNFVAEESYVVPADVDILRVLPHAHYLCRQMDGIATLPDGTSRWLFRIPNWNFDWQGDYEYAQPLFLPKGTAVTMRYTYDNSTNNARNPNQPPQRVKYGLNSTDEMAELWFQVLPRDTNALTILENDQKPRVLTNALVYNSYLLGLDPGNARAHTELGRALMFLNQGDQALAHLRKAIELQPNADEAHYALGLLYRMQGRLPEAKAEFQTTIRLNAEHYKAYGNLGLILLEEGNLDDAQLHFESALRINPDDTVARESLADVARARTGAAK